MNAIRASLAITVLALSVVAQAREPNTVRTEPTSVRPEVSKGQAPTEADRADIDRTSIVGNRELPKVLHIVPWKKPVPGELAGRPVSSVLDEALAPIDRDVFRRQLDYDAQAKARAQASPTASPR